MVCCGVLWWDVVGCGGSVGVVCGRLEGRGRTVVGRGGSSSSSGSRLEPSGNSLQASNNSVQIRSRHNVKKSGAQPHHCCRSLTVHCTLHYAASASDVFTYTLVPEETSSELRTSFQQQKRKAE